MERAYTGLTARVKIHGTIIGYINSVNLNLEKDIIEVLQFGALYREKVPAIKNWTASSEGTVAFAAGESQHKLLQAFESGELIDLTIALDEMTHFNGKALVSSLSIDGAPDDKLNISVEFEGSGGVDFTLPQTFFVDISSGVGGTTEPAGSIRVVANTSLVINVVPSAGKASDKYFTGPTDTTGTPIMADEITLTNISADKKIRVTFKDVV